MAVAVGIVAGVYGIGGGSILGPIFVGSGMAVAVLRYRRAGQFTGPLSRLLLAGTLLGVIVGAVIRVDVRPGPIASRLVVAAVPLPLGIWLIARTLRPAAAMRAQEPRKRCWV
jgi:uncharacterized membrane protein YfcA